MNRRIVILAMGLLTFTVGACRYIKKNYHAESMEYPKIDVSYPKVEKADSTQDYFGTKIIDYYRWLENNESEETKKFVTAQNKVTFDYLSKIPFRDSIANRLTELYDYEKFGAPRKEGEKYYFYKNDGLQNQAVLYVQDNLESAPSVLLDPNSLSKDGTISVQGTYFSHDNKYMAYAVSDGGSDWQTFVVKDLSTGKDLEDKVQWGKFSGVSWYGDGFFYSRYPAATSSGKALSNANEYHEVWFHKLGSQQSSDTKTYRDNQHPKRTYGLTITEDEKFAILSGSESTSGNNFAISALPLANPAVFVPVVQDFSSDFNFIDNVGEKLFFLTNSHASNGRLIAVDATKPDSSNWQTVIPETDNVLSSVDIIGNHLVANYIKDAASEVKVFDLSGKEVYTLKLPEIGTVGQFNGKKDNAECFFTFTSFLRPNTVYKMDVSTGKYEPFKEPKLKFNPDDYITEQVFYKSKDGTKIPMFITHHRRLEINGEAPTLLYGYGGFNISVMPAYKPSVSLLLETGGIYAVANIRGGGEYGKNWHDAGTLLKKQNVFDDFIAAGEYLVKEKYTSSTKLAIEGRSNGGLLIGACMTQRPDLFAVAFPGVGVMDMLRYHKFTIGWAWATDYGTADDNAEMFKYLNGYSPVHNCRPAKYPATMVFTADHDDRVVPAHSYKFISALQAAQQGNKPCLIRIDVRAGHGAGKPTKMVIEEEADKYSFMFYNTGIKVL